MSNNTNQGSQTGPSAKERLAGALALFFQSISGSSDREMAGVAFELEQPVLKLVQQGTGRTHKRPR
jgi:hypothetical protein